MRITIKELADHLNLSKGTVSRVLNRRNDDLIPPATRERVREAAQRLGYSPNRAARSLATGQTHAVAFCTQDLTSISSQVIKRLERLTRSCNLDMLVHTFDRRPDGDVEHVISSAWQADAVLAYEPHEYVHLIFTSPSGAPTPIVSMGTYLITHTDFVGVNLVPEIFTAIAHLVEGGCRRIAYMEDAATYTAPDFRHQTYEQAVRGAGLMPEFIAVPCGARAAARLAVKDYTREHGVPDGLFCRFDDLAIGAYRGLRDLGLRIPEDVALVGCDGADEAEYLDPPLSTIVQPLDEMCSRAWDLLERRMADPQAPLQHITLPARFEPRGSSLRPRRL